MSLTTPSNPHNVKLPLPQFLKLLTNGNIPVPKAMAVAGKIYKEYGIPAKLVQLTDIKLAAAGIEDPNDRKLVLAALQKAGYGTKRIALKRKKDSEKDSEVESSKIEAGPSTPAPMTAVQVVTTPTKRRRRTQEKNEFLPDGPPTEGSNIGNLDFNEVLDEDVLQLKSTVVNRAPVMTAWATVVAERMNFKREEALSIASVYTEMNAVSKGITLGLYDKGKERGMEASRTGAQPFVEIMGRRPLYKTQDDQWRALSNGSPVPPMTAFSYISRSFRQTTPFIFGALRLLSESYTSRELNNKAWALYTEFRPEVNEWGKRSQVSCFKILSLRKEPDPVVPRTAEETKESSSRPDVNNEAIGRDSTFDLHQNATLSLDEYEAALDQDDTFDDVDLDYAVYSRPNSKDTEDGSFTQSTQN